MGIAGHVLLFGSRGGGQFRKPKIDFVCATCGASFMTLTDDKREPPKNMIGSKRIE